MDVQYTRGACACACAGDNCLLYGWAQHDINSIVFFSNFITDNPLSPHLPTGKYKTLKHLPDGSYAQEAMKGVGMHVKINGPDDSVIMAKDYEVRSYLVYF